MFVMWGENVYPGAIENPIRGVGGFCDESHIIITREKTMVLSDRSDGVCSRSL